jgi:hypothetical protein
MNSGTSHTNKLVCLGAMAAGLGLVLSGCSTPELVNDGAAASTPAISPLAPYECEQTKGDVRIVLIKVERATVFTSDNVQDPKPGKVYPVTTVGVVYRIDALGNEPIKNWNVTTDEIMIGTHRVGDGEKLPTNITPGSAGSVGPLGNEPRGLPAFDSKRSAVQEFHVRCGPVPSGMATLTLRTGFNDKTETFVFTNVPLN